MLTGAFATWCTILLAEHDVDLIQVKNSFGIMWLLLQFQQAQSAAEVAVQVAVQAWAVTSRKMAPRFTLQWSPRLRTLLDALSLLWHTKPIKYKLGLLMCQPQPLLDLQPPEYPNPVLTGNKI